MPSLHMLGHMVAMAVIATLVKQIMELNTEVNKLKSQLEDVRESPGCHRDMDGTDHTENTSDVQTEEESQRIEKDCEKNNSKKRKSMIKNVPSSGQRPEDIPAMYSSVWCHGDDNQMCQFENICYNSKTEEFVLFSHESSTFENVKMEDGSVTVDLSSVRDHNVLQTNVISLPSEVYSRFQITWNNETTLIFKPFLTDNLMHVFHDDIIPLHHTLKLVTIGDKTQTDQQSFNVQLFIFDNDLDIDDETKMFYELFSKFRIKTKEDFQSHNTLNCFRSVYIGLSKTTTWYDYGFSNPQGPLRDAKTSGFHIRSTANFLLKQLPPIIESTTGSSQKYLVLFTRKENRRIMNEHEVILQTMKNTGFKVVNLNLESYTLSDLITYVRNSQGIIAMHGSLMMLSMFLKPGSIVIELFPYAVNPSNYTPYKTLTGLSGLGLTYKAWANQNKENSVGHPDWSSDFGGLNHLESSERERILLQTEVPPHKCCKDTSWLYHIYQDTVVNASEVSDLVKVALAESQEKIKSKNFSGRTFHPSKIQKLFCDVLHKSGKKDRAVNDAVVLKLKWDIPWTLSYIDFENLHYEVLIQEMDSGNVESLRTDVNKLHTEISIQGDCYVWVRAVINDTVTGPYSDGTLCHISVE